MTRPTVFIAYPHEFKCYEKFFRKASKILSKLDEFRLVNSSDPNGFVDQLSRDMPNCEGGLCEEYALLAPKITHAIVFNSYGDFNETIKDLEARNIKTRVVSLLLVKVVNIDKDEKYDIYIGRGSTWGNPYAIGVDGDRDEVIRKFSYDFDRGFLNFTKGDLMTLRGKRLGCHCKPSSCHGDVLASYVNSTDDGR